MELKNKRLTRVSVSRFTVNRLLCALIIKAVYDFGNLVFRKWMFR